MFDGEETEVDEDSGLIKILKRKLLKQRNYKRVRPSSFLFSPLKEDANCYIGILEISLIYLFLVFLA